MVSECVNSGLVRFISLRATAFLRGGGSSADASRVSTLPLIHAGVGRPPLHCTLWRIVALVSYHHFEVQTGPGFQFEF